MEYINAFPGYECVLGEDNKMHNMYRGVDLGRGGYVYAEPGMYNNVALLDVASLHPHSIVALNKMGKYTERYKALIDARIALKHHDYDTVRGMLDGAFNDFLVDDASADKLAQATKLFLNSIYGFCSATFENPFRDSRDVENIVALRGALFMKTLQDEIVSKGYRVIHVKTDSCKVPNADEFIISFIQDFARKYSYEMELEAIYDRICLVNDAVYIAKYNNQGIINKGGKHANEWTATGAQFADPYIFKTLFSHEELEFKDLCQTKEVKSNDGMWLDFNEGLVDDTALIKELSKIENADGVKNGAEEDVKRLHKLIDTCHNYQFVGKVGLFCPIMAGCGGGELLVKRDDKYSAVTGTKGYRWLEAEQVKLMSRESDIDMAYFHALTDEAIETISKFGDFEWFTRD